MYFLLCATLRVTRTKIRLRVHEQKYRDITASDILMARGRVGWPAAASDGPRPRLIF